MRMSIIEALVAVIAPHECLVCGVEDYVLCPWCAPDALPPLPPRCYKCRALSDGWRTCGKCRRTSALRAVVVRTDYASVAQQLIHDMKFERVRAAAEPIARSFDDDTLYIPDLAIVTEAPTASSRVRQRGYDQARCIAKELARQRGAVYQGLLRRVGQSRQVGASRSARREQAQHFFEVGNSPAVRGKDVFVVDDVLTTGATLEAAAYCLKKAGARTVTGIVFAQKTLN